MPPGQSLAGYADSHPLKKDSENRQHPAGVHATGSSPGLAIARNARWLLDFGLSGVLDAILDLGLGSPDLGLAGLKQR